ncbi:hypothetical protein EUGRSUZ_I00798 [Eucalyptus grandis]|uniref:Uncharacterized protein n=2 Tax=Eucalyptus grandis TaxID=71139 RepID=A0ACC3JDF0_EUCGR|nr:hypothetical protein EUGRSUZ_I00798 [Eucalyptus grandis]
MAIIRKARRWGRNLRVYAVTRFIGGAGRSGRRNRTISNVPPETLGHRRQQPHPQDHHDALQIVVKKDGAENDPEDELRPPESEPKRVISIKKKLEQACNAESSWANLTIYRIPHYLKDGENKAYVPQIVSLGPYHHGEKHLRQMDQHKLRCLHHILKRTNHQIGDYLHSVKELEGRARACYEGPISMSSNEFVEMMVLDGCFMIELFQGFYDEGFKKLKYPSNDPVFSMQGPMHMIQQDMIMLENQIPFFILHQLYCLQYGDHNLEEELAQLALLFFDHMKPTEATDHMKPTDATNHSSNRLEFPLPDLGEPGELHCLALFRRSLLHLGVNREAPTDGQQQLIHCVTELRKAGIKFRERKTNKFWDIHFEDGSLQIPKLVIHDGTRSLFLNLIAFEQCHSKCNKITSYVIFMDNLINSPKDIKHLHNHGIIEHWLGSNTEVADLFNQLCQEVVFEADGSYLSALSEEVNKYSSHSWHRWAFLLKEDYFGNPWSIISFIAALVLLLLTFTQTFYAVYSYHRPS